MPTSLPQKMRNVNLCFGSVKLIPNCEVDVILHFRNVDGTTHTIPLSTVYWNKPLYNSINNYVTQTHILGVTGVRSLYLISIKFINLVICLRWMTSDEKIEIVDVDLREEGLPRYPTKSSTRTLYLWGPIVTTPRCSSCRVDSAPQNSAENIH